MLVVAPITFQTRFAVNELDQSCRLVATSVFPPGFFATIGLNSSSILSDAVEVVDQLKLPCISLPGDEQK